MKLVDLKCPNCGGKLIPVDGNSKIVICEYCNSQYVLEDDRVINYHVHQHMAPEGSHNTGDSSANRSGLLAAAGILLGLVILFGVGIATASRDKADRYHISRPSYSEGADYSGTMEEDVGDSHSPFYNSLLENIYNKPSDSLGEADLERLQYISIITERDVFYVDYSFEDPYENQAPDIFHLELKPEDWNTDDLAEFPKLVKVELSYSWADGKVLEKLESLKGLACHGATPGELAQWLEPGQLIELRLDGPKDLEGLSAFENLEILVLEDVEAPDIRQLAAMKNLRSLKIVEDEPDTDPFSDAPYSRTLTDYSAVSVLSGLEYLELESSAIRDVSFLKSLGSLAHLSLFDTEAISLEPLGELSQLSSLSIKDNASAQDYNFISKLTGLQSLTIDKDTSQPDPDLSGLEQLEELDASGIMSVSSLRNLKNLRTLSLHGCNIDDIQALSSLSGLESLTCYSVWTYATPLRNASFIDGMTSLKYLDFCGSKVKGSWGGYGNKMEIYGDISNVFNHEGLEELYLNECMFGLDFDKLKDNPSLKVLQMKEASIKKNIRVQAYSGMIDVWYDDVSMDENIRFLTHYPSLEELYLDGNQLTDIQFATELKSLERFSINNNYVTDLGPLNQAENLKYLDVRQNPINNSIDPGDSVEIIR
ncbi:MAG: leucine-rich repeat domain-containing protein [Lachnospiraceae bacterium]|jgi:Leucine-rich repeat (LRR) protein|nr:leucine-rich repeat domain-containing protein [Lachnospiraceae bacterium]